MIHGTETVAELSRNPQAFGAVEDNLAQLVSLGLIAARGGPPVPAPVAGAATLPAAQQTKQFLNESAVAVLGLRAFLFTLKLEHCYTEPEIRAILPEYRRVMTKAKGEAFAGTMAARAEAILGR